MLCDLEIFYNGKLEKIKTMIDTGNLLQDPITKEDVIIVEKDSLKNLVSSDILDNIENIVSGKWLNFTNIYQYKFKIIPFSSLGKENGILLGFKPDYIKVDAEYETVKSDVIIAIYDGKLSRSNLYSSLIGINILKEDKVLKK
ncbi:MAG: sigma-E processing peptidase SpoIIGA [Clostridia bacterium]|nr:sigma-E processing peptidase SpoIIGA [Clostridia bacterium]